MTDTYNITMQALDQVSIAYLFIQGQLKQANITLPPADQLRSQLSLVLSFIATYLPIAAQKSFALLDQLPIGEIGFIHIFFGLVSLYITHCIVVASLRFIYRLVYGFVRFSFIVSVIASFIYIAHQKHMERVIFPGSLTTADRSQTYNTV